MVTNRPMTWPAGVGPVGPSISLAIASGSPVTSAIRRVASSHAGPGSPGPSWGAGSPPVAPATTPRCPDTMWATTSRAVHPSQGDGASHRSGGTARTTASNPPATVRYRCRTSLMHRA